jgi:hypothetical protein
VHYVHEVVALGQEGKKLQHSFEGDTNILYFEKSIKEFYCSGYGMFLFIPDSDLFITDPA